MNPAKVEWSPAAEDVLTRIWLAALDRKAVTRAQAQIDALLASDPIGNSIDVAEGLRKLFAPPLLVFFSIDENGIVQITDVYFIPG